MKHKMETIKKLLQIAKGMEVEDAKNFKKKKLAPPESESSEEC